LKFERVINPQSLQVYWQLPGWWELCSKPRRVEGRWEPRSVGLDSHPWPHSDH